ncbi:MAG: hypothetical protein WEC34_04145 [Acidimicrobiia bacterium]
MSDDLDARLQRSFGELADAPSTDGVYEHVAAKRSLRRRVRRAQLATGSVVALLFVAGLTFSLTDDGSQSTVASGGAPGAARVVAGADVGAGPLESAGRRVPLTVLDLRPDEGYLRGPLLVAGRRLAVAGYDRSGAGFTVPPSRVVRARVPGGRVMDRVDLQGEILSLAEGEGARWALTHDQVVAGPQDPEFRVKRIGPDGAAASNAVPPGAIPAGDIVAFGGGVWLPVRDGVLRFDPVTGVFAARIELDVPAEHRGIAAFQKFVVVTDGDRLVRLDPASDRPGEAVQTIVDSRLGELIGVGGDLETSWLLGTRRSGPGALVYAQRGFGGQTSALPLPRDVDATAVRTANGVTWLDATIDGRPAALVLAGPEPQVEQTVVLPTGSDVAFTFLARDRALVAVDGSLRTIRL